MTLRERIREVLHPQPRQRTVDVLDNVRTIRDRAEAKRQRVSNVNQNTTPRQAKVITESAPSADSIPTPQVRTASRSAEREVPANDGAGTTLQPQRCPTPDGDFEGRLSRVKEKWAAEQRAQEEFLSRITVESELRQCVLELIAAIEQEAKEIAYRQGTYGDVEPMDVARRLETMAVNARDNYQGVI